MTSADRLAISTPPQVPAARLLVVFLVQCLRLKDDELVRNVQPKDWYLQRQRAVTSTEVAIQSGYETLNIYFSFSYSRHGAAIAQSVERLVTGWKVWGSNPGGGEILYTRPLIIMANRTYYLHHWELISEAVRLSDMFVIRNDSCCHLSATSVSNRLRILPDVYEIR